MEREPAQEHKRIHFTFYAKPLEVLGGDKVEGLRLARTRVDEGGRAEDTGETFDIACGLLVSAIGYRTPALEDLPFDARAGHFAHEEGRIGEGLYVAGWCGRGPQGVIGTNTADGDAAARRIVENEAPGGKPGGEGLERLLSERGVRWVDFDDWHAIDAAERAAAPDGAPRRKFLCVEDMLKVLDKDESQRAAGTKS